MTYVTASSAHTALLHLLKFGNASKLFNKLAGISPCSPHTRNRITNGAVIAYYHAISIPDIDGILLTIPYLREREALTTSKEWRCVLQ